jgi:hypothetical protein
MDWNKTIAHGLELPNLVVVKKWEEHTEYFGRIDFTTYGEIELENTTHGLYYEGEINLNDVVSVIEEMQETRFTIHDESLKFSATIKPEITFLRYEKGALVINYKWKEV